jgi:hypothetical protein
MAWSKAQLLGCLTAVVPRCCVSIPCLILWYAGINDVSVFLLVWSLREGLVV